MVASVEYYHIENEEVEFYEQKITSAIIDAGLSTIVDQSGASKTIKSLFKFAGPASVASTVVEITITADEDSVYADGVAIAAVNAADNLIAAAIAAALVPAGLPVAVTAVATAGIYAATASILHDTYQSDLSNLVGSAADEIFDTEDVYIDLVFGGQVIGGGYYRNNIGSQTKIDAVEALLDHAASDGKIPDPSVGMSVEFREDGEDTLHFDLIHKNLLDRIAEGFATTTEDVEGWSWGLDGNGDPAQNSDIIGTYGTYSTDITIANRNAKVAVKVYDKNSVLKEIAVAAGSIGFDNDAPAIAGGTQVLFGSDGQDNLGGNFANLIYAIGGKDGDIIDGGGYDDILYGDSISDTGNDGFDIIHGNSGNDYIDGGGGNDDLYGDGDDDEIYGGKGEDDIFGGAGDDIINGGDDNDTISGGVGSNTIHGADGTDTADYSGFGDKINIVIGADDNDEQNLGLSDDVIRVVGADSFDHLYSIEHIIGTPSLDEIYIIDFLPHGVDLVIDSGGGQSGTGHEIINASGSPLGFASALGEGTGLTLKSNGDYVLSNKDGSVGTITFKNFNTTITGSEHGDVVAFEAGALGAFADGPRSFDGAAQPSVEDGDLVDFSALGSGVTLTAGNGLKDTEITFTNFERLKGTNLDDRAVLGGKVDQPNGSDYGGFVWADMGAGNDTVNITGRGVEVLLGAGDDVVEYAGYGSIIHTGTGSDIVLAADNIRVMDADHLDRIYLNEDEALTGGFRPWLAESPWATGKHGIRYGINTDGDLVIQDAVGQQTFVDNYEGGPGVSNPTAGIQIGSLYFDAYRIFEPKPDNWIEKSFESLDFYWKAMFGEPRRPGADPLVLDLDGDGLELTAQTTASPIFDIDGDGFAEPTGWVSGDDGFLAWDINQNDKIDDVSELFGDASEDGFTALAALDSNSDSVIDALDTDFADLLIWQDLNQNGLSDAGELQTLAQAGIASISLTTSTPSEPLNALNAVTAVSSYTRTDSTTGEVSNVDFRVDNFNSVFLGDTTVSAAAADLPQLKGHGILPDLHVSMTLDPAFLTLVENTLPSLNVIDIDGLRAAATPILAAWGNPGGPTPDDLPALVHVDEAGETVVDDFGYFDPVAGYWKLASGDDVLDENEEVIVAPTYQDILDSVHEDSEWLVFEGEQLAFMERYLGEPLPIGDVPLTASQEAIAAVTDFLDFAIEGLNRLAVRLAMQGPLEPFFSDITYDWGDDIFRGDTDRQLIPVYEEILNAAPSDPGDAQTYFANWKPILDVVIGNFDRGEFHLKTTYDFLFANIVAAFETVGSPTSLIDTATSLGVPAELIVIGAAGTISGTDESDIIYLNGSNQVAEGGEGRDVYVVGKNFGTDVIDDVEDVGEQHLPDLVRFADIGSTEVIARRLGDDLIITVIATGDELTIKRQFEGRDPGLFGGDLGPDTGVAEIAFADGEVWDRLDMAYAAANPRPTSDTYVGTNEIDVLDGGAGNDYLTGGNETDVYRFGFGYGQDTIKDDLTNILLSETDYVQFLEGIEFSDLLLTRDGESDDLVIEIAGTQDVLTVLGQFDSAYTGPFEQKWFDRIEMFAFTDDRTYYWNEIIEELLSQARTENDDIIYGFDVEDILDGGTGNDYLSGGNENDTYLFGLGYGADTIEEGWDNIISGGSDKVIFGPGLALQDIIFSRVEDSNDLVISLANDPSILTITDQFQASYTGPFGTQWFDRVEAFEFQDYPSIVITWDEIITQLVAEAKTVGDDVIYGFEFEDVLDGGAGNDLLIGGNENDVYIFGYGYGDDIVDEQRDNILSGEFDIVSFNADVSPADVLLERGAARDDLLIRLAGSNDTLTIRDTFRSTTIASTLHDIEEFHFSDSTIWTLEDVRLTLLDLESTSGDDLIRGFGGADILDGGAGNDRLEGWSGDDVYIFGTGYGQDTIFDEPVGIGGGENSVEFTSEISSEDLFLSRTGDDLVISIIGTTDTLTIEDQFKKFATGPRHYEIAEFHFASGATWTVEDVQDMLLQGTSGADHLIGFNTDDVLDGGADADLLEGLGGDDTYAYDLGYGHDVIVESQPYVTQGEFDIVTFGSGILSSDLSVSRGDDDLILTIVSSSETLTIENYFSESAYMVEEFHFADATIWNDYDIQLSLGAINLVEGTSGNETLNGTAGPDILLGKGGDDTLIGGAGSDTYRYVTGDGSDLIDDGSGSGVDRLVLADLNADDVSFSVSLANINDLAITINATGEIISVDDQFYIDGEYEYGLEEVEFADGTIWNEGAISANAWYRGTAGDETIDTTNRDDVIVGNAGNDTLKGDGGSDIYLYASGDGNDLIDENSHEDTIDRLVLADLNADDVSFSVSLANINDLAITISATGEIITVNDQFYGDGDYEYGLEEVEFADGTIWNEGAISANAWYRGTAGDETIDTTNRDDVIVGNAGNDTLKGDGGSDTYLYASGDGNDLIDENSHEDTIDRLVLADLNADDVSFSVSLANFNDLAITINATGEIISVDDQFYIDGDYEYGLEEVEFADGTIWDEAAIITNAWYRGTAGDETINTTGRDDVIVGNAGNDTLNGGDGSDTYLYASGDGNDSIEEGDDVGIDILHFGDLSADDLTFAVAAGNPFDLKITVNHSGETLTIEDQFDGGDSGVEHFSFAGGTNWQKQEVLFSVARIGTSGDDLISGEDSQEVFVGGVGNDNIYGEKGADTYIYNLGDGDDEIYEVYDPGSSEPDRLLFGSGLVAADLVIDRASPTSDDVTLSFTGSSGSVFLDMQFYGEAGNRGIEEFVFGDEEVWTAADLRAAYLAAAPTSGDDQIGGFDSDDTLIGGSGNDELHGEAGADTYIYNLGDGDDEIYEDYDPGSSGPDRLVFGSGLLAADLVIDRASPTSYDVTLSFTGSSGSVFLDMQFYGEVGNRGIEEFVFGDEEVWTAADLRAAYLAAAPTSGDDEIHGFEQDDTVHGGDGGDSLYGHDGHDELHGGAGDDNLEGGAGNDVLQGSAGADRYIYDIGDGADLINDYGAPSDTDVLELGSGINTSNISVERGTTSIWDMLLDFGNGDQITVQGHFGDSMQFVEEVHFADSTVWTEEDLQLAYLDQHSTAGDDTINGFFINDVIDAGAGNDTIYAYDGDDTLTGGTGDDYLEGLQGNDAYHFGLGDGVDWIAEWGDPDAETDSIVFGAGITTGMVSIDRAADGFFDLELTVGTGGDAIRVLGQFNDGWDRIEEFRFSDSTVWTADDVKAIYLNSQTTSGDDTIYGFFGSDQIDGGAGEDALYGDDGDDTLIGGIGDDYLVGEGGSDTFVFASGEGYDWIGDFDAGEDSDDVIELDSISGFSQFSDVLAAAAEFNGDTYIDFDASNGIALAGVSLSTLHADDFRFV